ncbi:hypothetical protein [Dietzia sp. 179-F 9C3 NHS]|uniref:hypothetical protein n=1 Tax=Dietzia sp. 179-F 9C3 NHS TaxID=3374295 RepID=UPI0038797373
MPASFITIGPGTLTVGGEDVACQATSMTITPNTTAEDPINVLCGDTVGGEESTTFTLSATFLQDDLKASGLTAYSWENMGKTVPFVYTPNTTNGASVSGNVTVRPLPIGGEVKKRNTHDVEWTIVGTPTPSWSTASAGE